jgi:DHA1 family bicyclomycin/chloramphenicol resistance-like MFS transporter
MVQANSIAGLLNLYPRNAGAASALFGVSQFGFGALAGVLVGAFFSGTPVAMALAMAIMAGGSFAAWLWLQLLRKTPATVAPK